MARHARKTLPARRGRHGTGNSLRRIARASSSVPDTTPTLPRTRMRVSRLRASSAIVPSPADPCHQQSSQSAAQPSGHTTPASRHNVACTASWVNARHRCMSTGDAPLFDTGSWHWQQRRRTDFRHLRDAGVGVAQQLVAAPHLLCRRVHARTVVPACQSVWHGERAGDGHGSAACTPDARSIDRRVRCLSPRAPSRPSSSSY